MSDLNRAQIAEINTRFADAFNRDDLDGVMEFFTDDAVYVEFNGKENHGKEEIRKAFEPQFSGDFGPVRFHAEDFFADEEAGKALARWRCTVELDGKPQKWEGLDIFHFEGALIKEKRTYAQAPIPLLEGT
jgi:ketosteroid isomerase-like protein